MVVRSAGQKHISRLFSLDVRKMQLKPPKYNGPLPVMHSPIDIQLNVNTTLATTSHLQILSVYILHIVVIIFFKKLVSRPPRIKWRLPRRKFCTSILNEHKENNENTGEI